MRPDAEIEQLYLDAVLRGAACRRFATELEQFGNDDAVISRQHVSSRWKASNILKVKLRILMTCDFIRERLGPEAISRDLFLDIGASSHLFARTLGMPHYLGANLLPEHVAACQAAGIPALVADACRMPFADRSVDHILTFECLEHVPEPGAMLRECTRIARGSLFVSIPFRHQTTVVPPRKKDPFSQHVIEFSLRDLAAYAAHFGLAVAASRNLAFYEEPPWFIPRHWQYRRWGWTNPSITLVHLQPQP